MNERLLTSIVAAESIMNTTNNYAVKDGDNWYQELPANAQMMGTDEFYNGFTWKPLNQRSIGEYTVKCHRLIDPNLNAKPGEVWRIVDFKQCVKGIAEATRDGINWTPFDMQGQSPEYWNCYADCSPHVPKLTTWLAIRVRVEQDEPTPKEADAKGPHHLICPHCGEELDGALVTFDKTPQPIFVKETLPQVYLISRCIPNPRKPFWYLMEKETEWLLSTTILQTEHEVRKCVASIGAVKWMRCEPPYARPTVATASDDGFESMCKLKDLTGREQLIIKLAKEWHAAKSKETK